jgi:hypothetical protein
MTEAEWLACEEPDVMWGNIWYPTVPGHIASRVFTAKTATAAQERLIRLCGCAFVRHDSSVNSDPDVLRGLAFCEAAADEEPDEDAYEEAQARLVEPDWVPGAMDWNLHHRYSTALGLVEPLDGIYWERLIGELGWQMSTPEGQRFQADLLRDIFGNPFRHVVLAPQWLTWNDGTVRRIAEEIYDNHRFADMPVLADALEDAGCDNADILAHCRGPGPHVRGCWVVDKILGKD